MATKYSGKYITAGTITVHTGQGYVKGILISHNQGAAQQVVFYDNTTGSGTVVLRVTLPANPAPFYCMFEPGAIAFATGLTVVAPANVDVNVWAVGR